MADSIYKLGSRDFQMSISAGLIGLCAHCLVHSGGARCERCGRILVGRDGDPMTPGRKTGISGAAAPAAVPVQPAPVPRKKIGGPYQDGTGPDCTALRHPEACPHYYVDRINGHCRLARTASFHPSKCRAMIAHSERLMSK